MESTEKDVSVTTKESQQTQSTMAPTQVKRIYMPPRCYRLSINDTEAGKLVSSTVETHSYGS